MCSSIFMKIVMRFLKYSLITLLNSAREDTDKLRFNETDKKKKQLSGYPAASSFSRKHSFFVFRSVFVKKRRTE